MIPLRVLFVEDSPDDALLILRELKRAYDVTWERVQTEADLRAALDGERWDLIISDWSMPGFSATDALAIRKETQPDVPFIIASGTVGEEVVVAALRGGAHDFFAKDGLTRLLPAIDRELREAANRRERAQMQEQLLISDRMASVGILAASVAHEINNPLTAVLGNLDLLTQDIGTIQEDLGDDPRLDDVLEQLRDAQEAATRIREIAKDLTLFGRADDDDHRPVDVREIVESSLRMARNETRHRCTVTMDLTPVPMVNANESRLGQVFLNLIVNAAQSIPEGSADQHEISVTTTLEGDHVVVAVRDTGAGIAPDAMNRLFTPFFTTKPIGVGSGLGLSICHRIVSSHGGTITVESSVGVGSVFRVNLPATDTTMVEDQPPARGAAPTTRTGSVLVVDDEESLLTLARRMLGTIHEVTVTTSAQEALDWITAGRRYDVILCDLMMPLMTGMELHAQLLELAPEQAEAMVFLTGGAFTEGAREFIDTVENRYVEKPVDRERLLAIVDDGMRRREHRAAT